MKEPGPTPRRPRPPFETIEKAAAFWEEHDTTEYVDPEEWQHLQLPHLTPSTRQVSMRLPEGLIVGLKRAGHRRGMPYQSLFETILHEWLAREDEGARGTAGGPERRDTD